MISTQYLDESAIVPVIPQQFAMSGDTARAVKYAGTFTHNVLVTSSAGIEQDRVDLLSFLRARRWNVLDLQIRSAGLFSSKYNIEITISVLPQHTEEQVRQWLIREIYEFKKAGNFGSNYVMVSALELQTVTNYSPTTTQTQSAPASTTNNNSSPNPNPNSDKNFLEQLGNSLGLDKVFGGTIGTTAGVILGGALILILLKD